MIILSISIDVVNKAFIYLIFIVECVTDDAMDQIVFFLVSNSSVTLLSQTSNRDSTGRKTNSPMIRDYQTLGSGQNA